MLCLIDVSFERNVLILIGLFVIINVITCRNFLYQGRNPVQTWGLVVMLLSKAAGHSPTVPEAEKDKDSGVLHTQRALAEITEMIRISHLVHQGMVNLQPITQSGQDQSQYANLTFGNKICLLSGDYLLGNSCAELSSLRYVYYQSI